MFAESSLYELMTMETSPTSSSGSLSARLRFWKWAVGVSAALCVIPPMFGLVGTVVGMLGAFSRLSQDGGADPTKLADDIATATSTTAIGLIFSMIGIVCLIISLVKFIGLSRLQKHPESGN